MEPPRPYHPYTTTMQPREAEAYTAQGGQHPYYPPHAGSAPPPPPSAFGGSSGPYSSSYGSEYTDSRVDKRRRGNLPKHVTDILRMWFQDHVAHPYPTEEEKQQLMHSTGLTISQVSTLFQNRLAGAILTFIFRSATGSSTREGEVCHAWLVKAALILIYPEDGEYRVPYSRELRRRPIKPLEDETRQHSGDPQMDCHPRVCAMIKRRRSGIITKVRYVSGRAQMLVKPGQHLSSSRAKYKAGDLKSVCTSKMLSPNAEA